MNRNVDQLSDPDAFASELHHWLLVEGLRSPNVRSLWRLARAEHGAELEQIFEIMIAEAKRANRESRKPSLLNLPVRSAEWMFEHARFTPPREVITTLFYVGVVIFGLELVKDRFQSSQTDQLLTNTLFTSTISDSLDGGERSVSFTQDADVANRVDEWFSDEVAAAMDRILESDEFRQKLRRVVIESIDVEIADEIAQARTRRNEPAALVESAAQLEPAAAGAAIADTPDTSAVVVSAKPAETSDDTVTVTPKVAETSKGTVAVSTKPAETNHDGAPVVAGPAETGKDTADVSAKPAAASTNPAAVSDKPAVISKDAASVSPKPAVASKEAADISTKPAVVGKVAAVSDKPAVPSKRTAPASPKPAETSKDKAAASSKPTQKSKDATPPKDAATVSSKPAAASKEAKADAPKPAEADKEKAADLPKPAVVSDDTAEGDGKKLASKIDSK